MTAFLHINPTWDISAVVNPGEEVMVYNRPNSESPIAVDGQTVEPDKSVTLTEVGPHLVTSDGHADIKLLGGQYGDEVGPGARHAALQELASFLVRSGKSPDQLLGKRGK